MYGTACTGADQRPPLTRKCVATNPGLIVKRDDTLCNFLEGGPVWGKDTKIIYRCM